MLDERRHLADIATWMFGSAAVADEIVQETYRRWYVLDGRERAAIPLPRAWLTRAAAGICLELIASTTTAVPLSEPGRGDPAGSGDPVRRPPPPRTLDLARGLVRAPQARPRPGHAAEA
jgi:DNA-directed RNA polymerase specialized sigma24 family protein